jgi:quinol monooxygenase YgiN
MSVTYLIEFDVKPQERERFLEMITSVLEAMRHEDTFLDCALHVDPADENHFMLHETWQSHEDVVNVQHARPYREPWHQALPHLLAGGRRISTWNKLHRETGQYHDASVAS